MTKYGKEKKIKKGYSEDHKMPEDDGWGDKTTQKTANHTKDKAQYRREANQAKAQDKAKYTQEEIQQTLQASSRNMA